MQASNTCPALVLFGRLIQLRLSPSLPPSPRVKLCKRKGICCTVVAHVPTASPFIWFFLPRPPRLSNWSLQSPSLSTENSHLNQIHALNSQIMQPGLSKRDQNVQILLKKERSQCSCFLLHRFHLWSEVKEMAHAELEALGHREIPFPESQPVLSVDVIHWAALQSKRCANYIYFSLLFLKSLICIFTRRGFQQIPL